MKKVLLSMIILVLAIGTFIMPSSAKVVSTKNATSGQMVYVAGNPDMYPIEYYDEKDNKYKGLAPEMYEKISKDSGVDFAYVSAGNKNKQSSLAENDQVEMISVFEEDAVKGLKSKVLLFDYKKDGETVKVYVGFTPIAKKTTVDKVTKGIKKFSKKDAFKVIIKNADDYKQKDYTLAIIVICILSFVILLLLINLIVYFIKKRKQKKNKWVDPLTGISNYKHFEYCYNNFITPISSVLYYVAYVAIDHDRLLRYANELTSHEIQKMAALEISGMLKDNDFAARILEGTFVVAFQAPDQERAEIGVKELVARLNNMGHSAMAKYNVYYKAGVYHLEDKHVTCDRAINNAQYGYGRAIESEKKYLFTDTNLLSEKEHENELEKRLWKAMNDNEFKVYLQYIYDKKGEKVCGAESLSRWVSMEEGVIYPNEFIPLLEKANLIDKLDMYMFESCCELLEEWSKGEKKNLWLSCNMTRVTLLDQGFIDKIKKIADKYDFDRSKLVLEVTENFYVDNSVQVIENIKKCSEMGFKIALDDFGCAFSSIRDMCDYPTDIVKIDLKMVANIEEKNKTKFFEGLVGFIHHMGMETVFECVEDEDDMQLVTDSGCDYVQGFLFARVNPADDKSSEKNLVFK